MAESSRAGPYDLLLVWMESLWRSLENAFTHPLSDLGVMRHRGNTHLHCVFDRNRSDRRRSSLTQLPVRQPRSLELPTFPGQNYLLVY